MAGERLRVLSGSSLLQLPHESTISASSSLPFPSSLPPRPEASHPPAAHPFRALLATSHACVYCLNVSCTSLSVLMRLVSSRPSYTVPPLTMVAGRSLRGGSSLAHYPLLLWVYSDGSAVQLSLCKLFLLSSAPFCLVVASSSRIETRQGREELWRGLCRRRLRVTTQRSAPRARARARSMTVRSHIGSSLHNVV